MGRRTKAEMQAICDGLVEILESDYPMTVRQVFYQACNRELIEKTESEYKNTVCRKLKEMRLNGRIPFGWISDNTRWMRKPTMYTGMEEALTRTARFYRKDLWSDLDVYVEVWLEKEALAGVLMQETRNWGVPLMVCRGYPSVTFLHEAAETIDSKDKPTHLYYFGDHDPSGRDISRNVCERINEFTTKTQVLFKRVAVEPWQIEEWSLPSRPTKRSDSRAKDWCGGGSVEVDAIPPQRLKGIARECIQRHVPVGLMEQVKREEEAARNTLMELAEFL
jgi:hypothetical protein